ncbi:phospholipase-like protein [Tanacetum coccineum]
MEWRIACNATSIELEVAFEYLAKSGGLLTGIHSLLSGKYCFLVKRVTCEYLQSELEGMRFGYVILRCCLVRRVTCEYLRSELEGKWKWIDPRAIEVVLSKMRLRLRKVARWTVGLEARAIVDALSQKMGIGVEGLMSRSLRRPFQAFVVVVVALWIVAVCGGVVVVPRVLITCRSRQVEVEGDGNENVPLYYNITDKFQIKFRREEFCLVTGLRFGVENLAGYNDREFPIPFRRWVFLSCYDDEHITGYTILEIIEYEVFDRLHDEDVVSLYCLGILQLVLLGVEAKRRIPNAIVKRWPKLYATQPTNEIDKKAYSIFGYTWAFKSATPYWQPAFPSHPGAYNLQSPIPSHMGNPNLQPPIERHHDDAGLFKQNILNRGKREQCPSFYKRTPYTKQHPTTILPKQRGNKNIDNVMKANLSPLNLRNAFDDENEGGDDVIFLGGKFTGNYLVYENVDPQKVKREHYVTLQEFLNEPKQIYLDCYMKGYVVLVTYWQQLVPHLCMPDIDSRTPIGWLSEEVFLPIHVGGNHWVMGVIDLSNAHVYVFDSMPNEGRRNLLWNQIQRWTPMVNNILQG